MSSYYYDSRYFVMRTVLSQSDHNFMFYQFHHFEK